MVQSPDYSGMHQQADLPWLILDGRNKFQIERHPALAFKGDSQGEADGEVISDGSSVSTGMGYQRQHKTYVTADGGLGAGRACASGQEHGCRCCQPEYSL